MKKFSLLVGLLALAACGETQEPLTGVYLHNGDEKLYEEILFCGEKNNITFAGINRVYYDFYSEGDENRIKIYTDYDHTDFHLAVSEDRQTLTRANDKALNWIEAGEYQYQGPCPAN